MYWPKEDSISVLRQEDILSLPVSTLTRGGNCSVKIQGKTHITRCLEISKNAFVLDE